MKYKRILLKLSGESFLGEKSFGIDQKVLHFLADEIKEIKKLGVEIAIVIGAGNIWRGARNDNNDIDRVPSDQMGMLGTIMNAIAFQQTLEKKNIKSDIFSAIEVKAVVDPYFHKKAIKSITEGNIVICAGGTGNPYFTTDSASTLRAIELKCDAVLKATIVDGVYNDDPRKNPSAKKYETVSFDEVLEKNLKVMDSTAIAQCRDNNMPIIVFQLNEKGNLKKIIKGKNIGTIVK